MKKAIIFLLLIISVLNAYSASNLFELKGKINGITFGNAELSYWILSNSKWEKITVKSSINKGKFMFKGYLNEPVEAKLKLNDIEETLYIEPTNMTLYISINKPDSFKFYGSKTHNEYIQLRIKTQKDDELLMLNHNRLCLIDKQLDSLPEDNPTFIELTNERKHILQKRDSLFNSLAKTALSVLETHPDSYYPLLSNRCLVYISNGHISIDAARTIYEKLSLKLKTSQIGIYFDNYLKKRENTEINRIAPDFIAIDNNKQIVKLSDYRGKSYVLLDFWASYCLPCIQGFTFLKKTYETYHTNGLQIIGVSTDLNENNWKVAINKYKISTWIQVLQVQDLDKCLQGFINPEDIVEKYPTDGIPKYILIDKSGKIVGKWEGYSVDNEKEIDEVMKGIFGY